MSNLAEDFSQDYLSRYANNPLLWAEEWLRINTTPFPNDLPPEGYKGPLPLWSKQAEIVDAVFRYKKVAVKSGHGIGKTYIAAVTALALFYIKRALIVTTAPTFRQVRRLLWGEIHKIYGRANKELSQIDIGGAVLSLGGKLNQTSLEMEGKWYMEGFSTDKPDSFQGAHEENICLIIDEAAGVTRDIYEAGEGILTSENSYVLLIGNPTDPTSGFYDACKPGSGYHVITLSCYDSPNVKHGRNIYSQLVAHDWPEKKKKEWGENTPMYQARVLGEFPEEGEDVVIPLRYALAALERYQQLEDEDADLSDFELSCLTCDVARKGNDRTIIGAKYKGPDNFKIYMILDEGRKLKVTEVVELIEEWIEKLDAPNVPICVDDIGVGGGVVDILEDKGYVVVPINVGTKASEIEDIDDDNLFLNLRAKLFWEMREDYINGNIAINDEQLANEVSKINYTITRKRKIQIESKEDIKDRLGESPDKADSQALSYGEYADPSIRYF